MLIIYLSSSLFIGSSYFFFIINFFLAPLILMKKFNLKMSSKITLIIILCILFLGILNLNLALLEKTESKASNPFFYFSSEYLRQFFAINPAYMHRGGAILWTYYSLKDEGKLFFGRGLGWSRSLTQKEFERFKILGIGYDFPMVMLLSGIFGLFIFLYLAYNILKLRIRITSISPELKFFILCLAFLYIIGGIYSQGWISKTTGYCFAMLIGILSNPFNKKYFIEKYFIKKKNFA